jgi:FAD-dependent urate hydroxylase
MSDVQHILIVGGGIGGLTLAAALRQRDFDVELIEETTSWRAEGAGISVQPNGLRVLRQLGSQGGAVIDAGSVIRRWLFADERGQVLCEIDLGSVWAEVGPLVGIARGRLQEVLVGGVEGVSCRLGTSIASLHEHDRLVSVRFTDGATRDYDLVVGADGIRSSVRRHAFGEIDPVFAGQISWRSLAPVTLPGPPSIQFWLGDRCFFGLCSVGHGYTYGFAYVYAEAQYDPVGGRRDRLRKRFSHFGDTVQEYLSHLEADEQIHCSTIEWVEQGRWHTGRVVLIGDAAHASSPMMGQGGSLAMEDAWVLAELLRAEPTAEQALSAYVQRRAPRVGWVQRQSRALAEAFDTPPRERNEIMRERGAAMFKQRYGPLVEQP